MKSQSFFGISLAAIIVMGAPLMAQVVSTPPVTSVLPAVFGQTFTTGMVGLTSNQTARLNVLNLNTVSAAITNVNTIPAATAIAPANCNLQLQFFDVKNNSLGQTVVMNFDPGTATSFDLPRTAVTPAAPSRVEIRGVVTVNPALPTPSSAPTPGYCSVKTTLEIFDDTTGSTVVLTSDTTPTGLVSLAGILEGTATAQ
jgi:hypothetical protein